MKIGAHNPIRYLPRRARSQTVNRWMPKASVIVQHVRRRVYIYIYICIYIYINIYIYILYLGAGRGGPLRKYVQNAWACPIDWCSIRFHKLPGQSKRHHVQRSDLVGQDWADLTGLVLVCQLIQGEAHRWKIICLFLTPCNCTLDVITINYGDLQAVSSFINPTTHGYITHVYLPETLVI